MPQLTGVASPLSKVGEAQYTAIWQKLFATILLGFWGRFFFIIFLALALFFGVRRRNARAAIVFVALALLVAFGGGIMTALNIF